MRLGKFTLLLLALLISLNACGTGQAVQPAEDSREITLKKAEDLLAQPDKVAVTSHYSAYAYASEEQFEKMADLLSDIDISAFTQITQEEERKQSYDETPNMVIDKGEKSFLFTIKVSDDSEVFLIFQRHLHYKNEAEFAEEFSRPKEENEKLILRGPYSAIPNIRQFEDVINEIAFDRSDPERCAEVTVLAESKSAEYAERLLKPGMTFILNKSNTAALKALLDGGASSTPKKTEAVSEENFDLKIRVGDSTYLFDTSTNTYEVNGEDTFILQDGKSIQRYLY